MKSCHECARIDAEHPSFVASPKGVLSLILFRVPLEVLTPSSAKILKRWIHQAN